MVHIFTFLVAHGAGAEANDLNRITKGYLNEHEEDVEQAQVSSDKELYFRGCSLFTC